MSSTIHTEDIKNWDSKPVKHKKLRYPQSIDDNSPKNFFVGLLCGSRNSGKTFSIAKLLKHLEHHPIVDSEGHRIPQRVVLFSPTAHANPVLNALKYLDDDDVILNYTDDKLTDVIDEIKEQREATKRFQEDLVVYKKWRKSPSRLSAEEWATIERLDGEPPEEPEFPWGRVTHLIFDDLVGSAAFKSVGKSALTNLVLRNRHLSCNILIATQSMKSIPKAIRNNASLFVLYRFANRKIVLDDVYEEVSGFLTQKQFEDAYTYATAEPHDALVIDLTGGARENRLRKNFNERLLLD